MKDIKKVVGFQSCALVDASGMYIGNTRERVNHCFSYIVEIEDFDVLEIADQPVDRQTDGHQVKTIEAPLQTYIYKS